MTTRRVIIVDAPARALWSLAARLQAERLAVVEAAGEAEARLAIDAGADVLVVHHAVDEAAALMTAARARRPDTTILGVVGEGWGEAERSLALAADGLMTTAGLAEGAARIIRLMAGTRERQQARALRGAAGSRLETGSLIGASDAIARVRRLAARLAETDRIHAIVTGETGTGRALVARIVHDVGSHAGAPFIRVDCALGRGRDLSLELFGDSGRPGAVGLADGGTLLLEHVDRLPLSAQLLLVKLIEESTFRAIDGFTDVGADLRVIATTDRRLEREVEAGRFRRDLHCRLAVMHIDVPPLRERGAGDVTLLARHFAREAARRHGRDVAGIEPAIERRLCEYDWPGNVRELQIVLERAVLLASSPRLGGGQFPGFAVPAEEADGLPPLPEGGLSLAALERRMVVEALERTGGNQTRAAELLGLRRDQVRYRMLKYGLSR